MLDAECVTVLRDNLGQAYHNGGLSSWRPPPDDTSSLAPSPWQMWAMLAVALVLALLALVPLAALAQAHPGNWDNPGRNPYTGTMDVALAR